MRTPRAELENHRAQGPVDLLVLDELKRRVVEWRDQKNPDAAQELIWATSVYGVNETTSEILREFSALKDLPDHLRLSADELFSGKQQADVDLTLRLDTRKVLQQQIRILKDRINLTPRDPIQYVELSRIYSRIGQTEQATKYLMVACNLAPTSRFVVRAAARFLVHIRNYELAIKIVDGANPSDPWVQATRISLYDLSERAVRDIKRSRAVLEIDAHPRHLSELAGSLATLEFGAGNVSRAKKLFKSGASDPNDNMVAQLQWASQNKIVEFDPGLLERSLTFEARASFAQKEKKWKEALGHCADWMQDEPLSMRPALLGSYVASELLQDNEKAVEFCELGLEAHPNEFSLLNNLAFANAALGRLDVARSYLEKASLSASNPTEEVVGLATSGMIAFREGRAETGSSFYEKAMELARKGKNTNLFQLVAVHYVAEVANSGNVISADEAEQIIKIMEDKRMSEQARDIFSVRIRPTLISHELRQESQGRLDKILPGIMSVES
jgi:tetratricopeptide (TPR) repeat protein